MAVKKSELYRSIWESCDALRGGMDASQYKDYVLALLFVKYISEKYAGQQYADIKIPAGASFQDMVVLIGDKEIGDKINKNILNPIAEANNLAKFPDFNDPEKLGKGKDMVDTLSNLIAIFNKPELNFSKNQAGGDDILGDAYEYLMRHFATESGKSKGQFYTPSEVSRILAKIIGINHSNSTGQTTGYDPTCGSGSLLLKLSDEAEKEISLFGQEKETVTAGLAKMNMILHSNSTAEIWADNTLSNPHWEGTGANAGTLKTFDYVVANPPFSLKNWTSGVSIQNDSYDRFAGYGLPPEKNGDYAFLLHIIKSLKSTGKGAVILPHGVLFRGNSEGEIRKNILKKGFVKGIIGLPANLFYGTGIPACILLIDKENAHARKGIFMIDAGKGFIKDGNKNRLRDQDIHKIVDTFNKQIETPKYSRLVSLEEIADPKNDYNLNIPRYIDTQENEDIQDIQAHLQGGIPASDVQVLNNFWKVYPNLEKSLFQPKTESYVQLKILPDQIKSTIFSHSEFTNFQNQMTGVFEAWKTKTSQTLQNLDCDCRPKNIIKTISEDLLEAYSNRNLIDKYDVYQHLMDYYSQTLQDDLYVIASGGWKSGNEVVRMSKESKNQKKETVQKDVDGINGLEGKLIPPSLIINLYFTAEQDKIDNLNNQKEEMQTQKTEMEEEYGGESGLFGELEKINKAEVAKLLKEKKAESPQNAETKREIEICNNYLNLLERDSQINAQLKILNKELENKTVAKYPKLTIEEIKTIVVLHKWMYSLETAISTEMDKVSQTLTGRIKELAQRYQTPLPEIEKQAEFLEEKVKNHLREMGFGV